MASIDVQAPLRAVFDRWTAFDQLPQFVPGLEAVRVESPDRLSVRLAGAGEAFPAQVTEEHLVERVAWRSLAGPHHAAVVTLRPLADGVQVDLTLEGPLGDAAHVLERFKELAEAGREAPAPGVHADILHPGATRGLGDDASTIRG